MSLKIYGSSQYALGAVIPPSIEDPFALISSSTTQKPLALLGLSLLGSLRTSTPESVVNTITVGCPLWKLSVSAHRVDPLRPFLLEIHTNSHKHHEIKIRGHVRLDRFPKLDIAGIDLLAHNLAQAAMDFTADPAYNGSNGAQPLERANMLAIHFCRHQQDFIIQELSTYNRGRGTLRWISNSTYVLVDYGCSEMNSTKLEALKIEGKNRFFVALGSNVGDRLDMIEKACLEMEKEGMQIVHTSGLWETRAMYVEDQASFLNGVCEVGSDTAHRFIVP